MNPRRSAILLPALMVAAAAAGCLDGGLGGSFAPIAAPLWEPGHSWTYAVGQAVSYHGYVGPGGAGSGKMTMRVTNTTQPLWGHPAYYVALDGELEHPLFDGAFQAYAQSDLRLLARAYNRYANPVSETTYLVDTGSGPAYVPVKRHDPCDGVAWLEPVESMDLFPAISFPLSPGARTEGVVGDQEQVGLAYTGRIHGLVDVNVPAGKFRAVYISYDFVPFMDPAYRETLGNYQLRAKAEYWYSPEVRNYVRSSFSMSGQFPDFDDEVPGPTVNFAFLVTLDLDSFSLVAGPAEPAPQGRDPTTLTAPAIPYSKGGWAIGSDQAFPINVGEGPVTARFALVESPMPNHYGKRATTSRVETMKELPNSPLFDPARFQVSWAVMDSYQGFYRKVGVVGDTFNYTFERAGQYAIQARVEPTRCGDPWPGEVSAWESVYWERTFPVSGTLGAARTVKLGSVPIEPGLHKVTARWSMHSGTALPPTDGGKPELVDSGGRVTSPSYVGSSSARQSSFGFLMPGTWTLQWNTEGPTVGNSANLVLRADYGDSAPT